MMPREEKNLLIQKLNKCQTAEEILQIVMQDYDCNVKLGSLVKPEFISGAIKVINLIGAKKR